MSELGHDKTMVSPAFGTTHGLCHSHVLSVPLPGDDIVNQMPFPRVWVHPRCLVTGGKAEQCVGDDKVLGTTHLKEQKAVAIEVASCQFPFQVWRSVPTLALNSPRIITFSDCGTAAMRMSRSS